MELTSPSRPRISGGFASPEEAATLQLTLGTPVFRINALDIHGANNTIEWTHGCWPIGWNLYSGRADRGMWTRSMASMAARLAFSGNQHRA
jgi:hypothetical protein